MGCVTLDSATVSALNSRDAPSTTLSAPRDSEPGTELLRTRLSLWLGVTAVLAISFNLSANVAGVLAIGRTWAAQVAHPGNWAVTLEAVVIVALWLFCRTRRPSLRVLEMIDVGVIGMLCLVGAYLSYLCPASVHPGLDLQAPPSANLPIGVVSNIAMLSMRAALLPSTPLRTTVVGVVSTLPVIVAAVMVQQKYQTPDAISFALGTTLVSVVVIPIPTFISRTIYNLREQVREAAQLGQYVLEEKIGEGGMGIVYRARHAFLRRPTAIKLLHTDRVGVVSLGRFEREVLQTSRLTHPNTVAIYDYGRTASGVFYYAMEYLDGVSLEQLGKHDGPQPPGRVIHLMRQACGALAEAHRRGLIHRDVKPANLYLCVRGDIADHVKVLDFGLVKELDTTEPGLSTAGSFLGSPLYMAPEAISKPDEVDGRSDIYALGAVAYFLLTQTPPFPGKSLVQICSRHLHEVPEPPSKRLGRAIPSTLEALILRCLEKKPDARPTSAAELASALAACTDVEPWTDANADEWWRERAPILIEQTLKQRALETSSSGERSVSVALDDRALAGTVPLSPAPK
jgi:eukaryotic-like serine/threonine-protein kinase